jgi:hypothetical protein
MRLLFAIPHYFDPDPGGRRAHGSLGPDPAPRLRALTACLTGLQQLFGRPQCVINITRRTTTPANQLTAVAADVVVCTAGGKHLLDRLALGPGYFAHLPTAAAPRMLGFECHAALRDRLGAYDFYCYLEDDLLVRDPLFFVKLRWFNGHFGDAAVLAPNRYEVARDRIVHKAYVDGPVRPGAAAFGVRWVFRRTTNPHCGGFFLTARQMAAWAAALHFLDRDVRFTGPLESAATLGVMRTFRVYKPADESAAFLELEHDGSGFLGRIKPPRGT